MGKKKIEKTFFEWCATQSRNGCDQSLKVRGVFLLLDTEETQPTQSILL